MHSTELKWIESLQNTLCNPLLDQFFIFYDYLDSVWFLLLLLGGILYFFNRKKAVSLLFIFFLSGICNTLLKHYFQMPRPCHLCDVGLVWHKSYGFPSGAAQTATIIAGFALFQSSRIALKIGAIIFATTLCFSRIYLGVHFFTDILGGIVVAGILLSIFLQSLPIMEKRWTKVAMAISCICLIFGKEKMLAQAAMMVGLALGLALSKKTILFPLWRFRITAFVLAVLGASGFLYLGEAYRAIQPITCFIAPLWFVYIANILTEKITLRWEKRYTKLQGAES